MRNEIYIAVVIYFVTISVLFIAIYRFLENWNLTEFTFFIAGVLVLLMMIGWGYLLIGVIFKPTQERENRLLSLTTDIIHELNIPLSTIKANSLMLKKSLNDEKSLKRLQRIDDASVRLKKLYDELVYTITKEIKPIEKEKFNINTLLQDRIIFFKEQKRNPFDLKDFMFEIKVDKIGFEQIIDNLISNAMKYSSKDKMISIYLEDEILFIEDRGIGMSTTELLRLYERYFQADEKKVGEGIGLSLVKEYCEYENIEIKIDSSKEIGTKIMLDLSKVRVKSNLL